jgi:hypothetical protein
MFLICSIDEPGLCQAYALDRVYKLAVSMPEAPLLRFRAATAGLPRTTEAESGWLSSASARTCSVTR